MRAMTRQAPRRMQAICHSSGSNVQLVAKMIATLVTRTLHRLAARAGTNLWGPAEMFLVCGHASSAQR